MYLRIDIVNKNQYETSENYKEIKILVPNKYIMTSFEKNVAPIIDAMMMLHKENQNLIKQRDLLLPRLMSGKLEVEM